MSIYRILTDKLVTDYEDFPIFGLLLYSDQDSNGHMGIVLSTEEYIERINKRSGSRWMVYSLKLLTPVKRPVKTDFTKLHYLVTNLPPYEIEEPNKNKEIMMWFDIRRHEELPCIIIFTFDQQTKELLFVKEPIQGRSPADTFNKLYKIIKNVSSTLDEIQENYLSNRAEIFYQIEKTLSVSRQIETIKKAIRFISPMELIKYAASLFS